MSSSIVNVIVFCKSTNRTLFPWQIAKIHPPSATFRSFFAEVISTKMVPRPDGTVGSISEVFVGKRKDLLDLVDPDLQIIEVTPTFGHFIKYYVRASECTVTTTTTTTTTVYSQLNGQCRNAFQIMMAAQTVSNYQMLTPILEMEKKDLEMIFFHSLQPKDASGKTVLSWRNTLKVFFKVHQMYFGISMATMIV